MYDCQHESENNSSDGHHNSNAQLETHAIATLECVWSICRESEQCADNRGEPSVSVCLWPRAVHVYAPQRIRLAPNNISCCFLLSLSFSIFFDNYYTQRIILYIRDSFRWRLASYNFGVFYVPFCNNYSSPPFFIQRFVVRGKSVSTAKVYVPELAALFEACFADHG